MHLVDCWNTCFIWYWFSILNRNKRRFHAFYTVHLLCLRNFILQNASLMGHLFIQFFANIRYTLHISSINRFSSMFSMYFIIYTCILVCIHRKYQFIYKIGIRIVSKSQRHTHTYISSPFRFFLFSQSKKMCILIFQR